MSQTTNVTTTTRAPATTTPAALSPQASTSRPLTARQLTSEIRGAHAHLIARLAAVPPNMIGASLVADEDDLELRADHLRIVLRATADYVGAFMRDTAYFSHAVQIERKYLDGLFDDTIGDLCGAIENAATSLRAGYDSLHRELEGVPSRYTAHDDGIPEFLDRRKANGIADASFVDLVEGGADV
jgi:hypothetical protein